MRIKSLPSIRKIIHDEVEFFFTGKRPKKKVQCLGPYCTRKFKPRSKNHYFHSIKCYRQWIWFLGGGHIMGQRKRD